MPALDREVGAGVLLAALGIAGVSRAAAMREYRRELRERREVPGHDRL